MKLQSAEPEVELHSWRFDFGASVRAFLTYLIPTSALASEGRYERRQVEPAGPLDGFKYNQDGSLKRHPD